MGTKGETGNFISSLLPKKPKDHQPGGKGRDSAESLRSKMKRKKKGELVTRNRDNRRRGKKTF